MAKETEAERKPTRYVVMRLGQSGPVADADQAVAQGDIWHVIGEFDTHGQDAAKHAAAEEQGAGTYVACPASSWKPTPYGERTVMVPLTGMEDTV